MSTPPNSRVYEVLRIAQEPVDGINEVAGNLLHPGLVWLANDAGDLHAAGLEVDDEEHVGTDDARQDDNFNGEEIRRAMLSNFFKALRPMAFALAANRRR